jgi:hypothetical protein
VEKNSTRHHCWALPLVLGVLGAVSASALVLLPASLLGSVWPGVIHFSAFALAIAFGILVCGRSNEFVRPNLARMIVGIAGIRLAVSVLLPASFGLLLSSLQFSNPATLRLTYTVIYGALQGVAVFLGASFATPKLFRPLFIGIIGVCGALLGAVPTSVWSATRFFHVGSLYPFVADAVFGICLGYFLLRGAAQTSQLLNPASLGQSDNGVRSIGVERPAAIQIPLEFAPPVTRIGAKRPDDATVVALGPVEGRLQAALFLVALSSSVFVCFFIAVPLVLIFTPSSAVDALGLTVWLLFVFLCACAVVRMWRPVIGLISLVVGVSLLLALPLTKAINIVPTVPMPDHAPMLLYGVILLGLLLGSSISMLFGWRILADGWRLATTSSQDRELFTTVNLGFRGFLQTVLVSFGIHPICGWLPQIWRRLITGSLFVLSSIAGATAIIMLIYFTLSEIPKFIASIFCLLSVNDTMLSTTCSVYSYMLFYGLGLVVSCVAAASVLRYLARRFARLSVENLSRVDKRAPVLFLRSFQDDQVKLLRPRRGLVRWLTTVGEPSPTLDHVLLEELTPLGPVVAIGMPGLPAPFGAARTFVDNDEWQNTVATIAKAARMIVIVVDDTPGVQWELGHIDSSGYSSKTVYLLPPRLAPPLQAARIIRRELIHSPNLTGSEETSVPVDGLTAPCVGWRHKSDGKIALFTSARPTKDSYVCALRLVRQDEAIRSGSSGEEATL